jgi:hypothetical protein
MLVQLPMRARTGMAQLPLHGGKAPAWLFSRMVKLAREISVHIVSEFGSDEMLRRVQALKRLARFGDERVRARLSAESGDASAAGGREES